MSLFARQHPDVIGKPLEDFHWGLVETQTTSCIVDILKTFFDRTSKHFDLSVPWLIQMKDNSTLGELFITKVFPFTTRKFPLIATVIDSHSEKPTYVGADNLMYIDKYIGSDGLMHGQEVFGGMDVLQVSLLIACLSAEERRKLIDAIRICFTHYFKTVFVYQDDDKSFFAIAPYTEPFRVGNEKEIISDEQELWVIYGSTVTLSVLVEYRFKDYSKTFIQLQGIEISGETNLKE